MTGRLTIFDDGEALAWASADLILREARAALAARGAFHWFLSGGRTPSDTFAAMVELAAGERELWEAIHVYWGDERRVEPDDPLSNYGAARRHLLEAVPIDGDKVHRMQGELADGDEAARRYEALLPERPDLVLLGMGADGHTASLFPDSPALTESVRRVLPVTAPAEPPERLTVTPPVIVAARSVFVLVAGSAKAPALGRAFAEEGSVAETPVRLARQGTWLVDRAAASALLRP